MACSDLSETGGISGSGRITLVSYSILLNHPVSMIQIYCPSSSAFGCNEISSTEIRGGATDMVATVPTSGTGSKLG